MNKRLISITSMMLFIELLDSTITHASLNKMANDFSVNVSYLSFSVVFYVLGTCLFIPAVSYIRNRYNPKIFVIISMLLFAISSALCANSNSLFEFSLLRFIQGLCVSICYALLSILTFEGLSTKEIIKINNIISVFALAGIALGPFIGAIFTQYLSWRIAFLINVPFVVILIFMSYPINFKKQIENFADKFDYSGFILLSLGLSFSAVGFEVFSNPTVNFLYKVLLLISGFIFFILYIVFFYLYPSERILNLSVFKIKNYLFGAIVNLFMRIAMGGFSILLVLTMQNALNESVVKSGFVLFLMAFSGIFAKAFIQKVLNYISLMTSCYIFSFLMILSFISFFYIGSLSYLLICILSIIYGFIISCLYSSMNAAMLVNIPKEIFSSASNIQSIMQLYCLGLGVSFSFYVYTHYIENNVNLYMNRELSLNAFYFVIIFLIFSVSIGIILSFLIDKLYKNNKEYRI